MQIEPVRRRPIDFHKLTRAFVNLALADHGGSDSPAVRPPTAPEAGTAPHSAPASGVSAREAVAWLRGAHGGSSGEGR